jgi:hypothetical protein
MDIKKDVHAFLTEKILGIASPCFIPWFPTGEDRV